MNPHAQLIICPFSIIWDLYQSHGHLTVIETLNYHLHVPWEFLLFLGLAAVIKCHKLPNFIVHTTFTLGSMRLVARCETMPHRPTFAHTPKVREICANVGQCVQFLGNGSNHPKIIHISFECKRWTVCANVRLCLHFMGRVHTAQLALHCSTNTHRPMFGRGRYCHL